MIVDYKEVFRMLPYNYLIIEPDAPKFTILDVTDFHLKLLGTTRLILGQGLFEAYPDSDSGESSGKLIESLMKVISTKVADKMPVIRYDVSNGNGGFEQRYWSIDNFPIISGSNIKLLINASLDITSVVNLNRVNDNKKTNRR